MSFTSLPRDVVNRMTDAEFKVYQRAANDAVLAEFGIDPYVSPVAKKRGALLDGSGVVATGGAPLRTIQNGAAVIAPQSANGSFEVLGKTQNGVAVLTLQSEPLVSLQHPTGQWFAIGLRPGWQYCLGASMWQSRPQRRLMAA